MSTNTNVNAPVVPTIMRIAIPGANGVVRFVNRQISPQGTITYKGTTYTVKPQTMTVSADYVATK